MGKNLCLGDSYLYLLNSTYHTTKYGLLKPQRDHAKSNPIHLYIQREPPKALEDMRSSLSSPEMASLNVMTLIK